MVTESIDTVGYLHLVLPIQVFVKKYLSVADRIVIQEVLSFVAIWASGCGEYRGLFVSHHGYQLIGIDGLALFTEQSLDQRGILWNISIVFLLLLLLDERVLFKLE